MSVYPLMLEGTELKAVVVGGGAVATRKVLGLLQAGASVRVVAPEISDALELAALSGDSLRIMRDCYTPDCLADALLVIAATNDAAVNATIARDARGRLINVITAPERGNCVTPAVHRAGDVVVAVSAGGVPAVAARIRDRIAGTIDDRYALAAGALAALRRRLLDNGEQPRWARASADLVGSEFCDEVARGGFEARVAEWR